MVGLWELITSCESLREVSCEQLVYLLLWLNLVFSLTDLSKWEAGEEKETVVTACGEEEGETAWFAFFSSLSFEL